jgi:2-methylcitrate dehydratase PrpD
MSIEREIAEWASALEWARVPAHTRERVETIHLDALASGIAGATQQLAEHGQRVASAFGGDSPASRTFARAYEITSATLCDVYRPGLCHVTPVVLPPLEALGADERDQDDFFAAFTVGLEVTTRLCLALDYPRLRERGWHSPGVAGPVGAAAAVARLLHLDADGMLSAMAHGSAQSAGTFAALGTEAVKFNQARGAASGLLAGLAAENGLAAASLWLTAADGGMAHAYADGGAPELLVRDLGSHWELEQISLRRWPAASSVQSLIEVCLELDISADEIAAFAVELSPRAYEVSGDRGWSSPLAAQQSARWVAACTLLDGDWWLEHSDPERLGDARIVALAERISVAASDAVEGGGVRVHLRRTNGEESSVERTSAPGDPERPLSRADVQGKLARASRQVMPA